MGAFTAIRDNVLSQLTDLKEEEVMYYIYGVFHSKQYEQLYSEDLAKSFPRLPNLKHKDKYVEIGRKLAELHLNYEKQPAPKEVELVLKKTKPTYKVKKMKPATSDKLGSIIYNEDITIKNIPERAYNYVVNGRSAIGWIIDQYRIKVDKKSGITDDPNDFSEDPKYILNLLLSIITVSMKTLELIDELPEFEVVE